MTARHRASLSGQQKKKERNQNDKDRVESHHCRLHCMAVEHLVLEVSESNRKSRKSRVPAVLYYQLSLLLALPCTNLQTHTWDF